MGHSKAPELLPTMTIEDILFLGINERQSFKFCSIQPEWLK